MNSPRLLFIHPYFGKGGAEKSITVLSNSLIKQDWLVDLFTLTFDSSNSSNIFSNIYISKSTSARSSFFKLLKLLFSNNYDYIVVNQAFAISLYNLPLRICEYIFNLKYSVISFERLSPEVFFRRGPFLSIIFRQLYYWSLLASDKILANSYEQIFEYKKIFSSKIVHYVPNSSCLIHVDTINYDSKSKNILWMGRLSDIKRPNIALDVIRKLPSNWNLYFAGDGPLKYNLIKCVITNSLSSRVFFGDINEFKNISFNHLLHTSCYEGLPNSVLESLACGLPVVATQFRTGLLELFVPGWLYIAVSDSPSHIVESIMLSNSQSHLHAREQTDIANLIESHYSGVRMSSCFTAALLSPN